VFATVNPGWIDTSNETSWNARWQRAARSRIGSACAARAIFAYWLSIERERDGSTTLRVLEVVDEQALEYASGE
jgi:hypothetical protein